MSKNEILIRKRSCIDVQAGSRPRKANLQDARALAFQAETMRLGYMLSEDALSAISTLSDTRIEQLYRQVVSTLRGIVGDDVKWEPFYPNFPKQVEDASDFELYFNAIVHYWTFGQWRPTYEKEARIPAFENVEFQTLDLAGPEDILEIFTELLSANASITDQDRKMLSEIMDRIAEVTLAEATPESIPFKENLCWFVGECVQRGWHSTGVSALNTATDILRVATHLSGGDVSLAANTKFKSFSRPFRRALVGQLEKVANKDDIFRHRGKWIRLAHSLHIGEYVNIAPRATGMLSDARKSNFNHKTFDGRVEAALKNGNSKELVALLQQRPGVFARRLDHVIRTFGADGVVSPFLNVADQVDTRVLLQLYGHFNGRRKSVDRRVVFPKGGTATSHLLTNTLPAIRRTTVDDLRDGITEVLENRFSALGPFKAPINYVRSEAGDDVTAYIDPALRDCPIPLSLRSASEGMHVVARGTKIPLAEGKDTLRMFIYWKGQDIDLSGFFVNDDFSKQETISYYNLREDFACHSGDITQAPRGASEFIDVDMNQAVARGYRYLVMSVLVYSGPNFNEHDVCYAGWMTRSKPKSNEIYDPKTVEQRVDLQVASKRAIPVIFDMVERKAIWLDLSTGRGYDNMVRPNNVATNRPALFDSVTSALNLENKPTLYDLFEMHAQSRADYFVEKPEDADISFGWSGDVTPFDATKILAEYL